MSYLKSSNKCKYCIGLNIMVTKAGVNFIWFSVISQQRSSSIESCLPSKVVFHQGSSSIKGLLPSKVVFHQRLTLPLFRLEVEDEVAKFTTFMGGWGGVEKSRILELISAKLGWSWGWAWQFQIQSLKINKSQNSAIWKIVHSGLWSAILF